MGADKNSSPKRELGLYPKFTATDSHTSLPRSRSHNGSTNPRNKPQTIPKWKHKAKDLAILQEPWRTVRGPGVEGPRSPCGRSATHDGLSEQNDPTGTSTRGRSVPHPRTVREQLVPRGQSATSGRTVRQTPSDQKQLANRIETIVLKNTRRTRKTPGRTTPRVQSTRTPRTVRQAREQQPEPETETTKAPTRPWISQTAEALEERFGEDVKRP
jgi:hypothetical protein